MTSRSGASTPPMVPTKKPIATIVRVFFRPRLSLSRPPIMAPKAAPKSRVAVIRPSV